MSNETKRVPVEPSNQKLADRLSALATAVTKRDWSEFTMRIPADPKRDADLVLSEAARRLRAIEAAPAPDDLMKNNLASGVVPARLAAPDDEPTTKSESISSQLVDDELARLEHTLSEWFCDDVLEDFQLRGILTSTKKWSDVSGYASSMRVISLQWLVWTGRIERHPDNPNRVRLRENQHASKGL